MGDVKETGEFIFKIFVTRVLGYNLYKNHNYVNLGFKFLGYF